MFPKPDYPSKFAPSYWTEVGNWIHDVASRYLLAVQGTEAFPADSFELAEHVWSEIRIATDGFEVWAGRYGMSREDLDSRIHDKAVFLLTTFKPAIPRGPFKGRFKRAFTRDECARGGRAGTKEKYNQQRLQALQALPEGLTPEEQAEALECSMSTLWRLRKRLRVQQTATQQAEISAEYDALVDAVVGPLVPAQAPLEGTDDDALLAALDAEDEPNTFPEIDEPVPAEPQPRITDMTEHLSVPDHVPTDWTTLAEDMRREAEARVTHDMFQDIEVSA